MEKIYNYHAHTHRCGHASGTEREYIERAISCGIKKMGFSDHIPFMHDDGVEQNFRVPVGKTKDYFDTLKALREEYKDKIEIFIGFEMEYMPTYADKMIDFALSSGAEYFILGHHFLDTDRPDGKDGLTRVNLFEPFTDEKLLKRAIDQMIMAVKSGYISIIAHPDHVNFRGDEKAYKREYLRLARACNEEDVAVEINCLGIRDGRHYPNPKLWEIFGKTGVKVVYGFDAHDAISAYDGQSLEKVEEMIEKYNLNFISDPKLKLFNR